MRLYRGYVWLVVWGFIVINVGFRDIIPVTRLTPCGFHVENWGVSAPATMILVLGCVTGIPLRPVQGCASEHHQPLIKNSLTLNPKKGRGPRNYPFTTANSNLASS